jgi:hypothetical protein
MYTTVEALNQSFSDEHSQLNIFTPPFWQKPQYNTLHHSTPQYSTPLCTTVHHCAPCDEAGKA